VNRSSTLVAALLLVATHAMIDVTLPNSGPLLAFSI